MRFRLNRYRNRWEDWKARMRQTEQAVTAEVKMCPSCRAFVPRGAPSCPYCGQRLKVWAASPAGKIASRAMPSIPVTGWLILANIVFFVLEYAVGGTSLFGNLLSGPSPRATLRLGESLPLAYVVGLHQYWRWVTACFLHAGLLHIGFNMWALYEIGPMVESFYGGAKYFTVYLLTGICGYAVSSYWGFTSLGASGAIFGVLGLMIAYGTKRSHTVGGRQLRSVAVKWAIYALVLAFVIPHVDNAAHLGGLASGFILGMLIGDDPPLTESQIQTWHALAWVMAGVLVASIYFMATARPLL